MTANSTTTEHGKAGGSAARSDLHDARPEGARLLNVPTAWWDSFAAACREWSLVVQQLRACDDFGEGYALALRSLRLRTVIGVRMETINARAVPARDKAKALTLAGLSLADAAECLVLFRGCGDGLTAGGVDGRGGGGVVKA
jgi:hypothetical protein